jgi:thioredoxin reductase (NADPH)
MNQEPAQPLYVSFAGFSAARVKRLRRYGSEETLVGAAILFVRGDRDVDMFVVLDGELEIFAYVGPNAEPKDRADKETVLARLRKGQFTGELDLLDNRRTLLGCRSVGQSRVLRINRASLTRIMRTETEIANLIMQACIGRRVDIVRHAAGGLVLIG